MIIRNIKQEDKNEIIEMMRVFYSSDAVHTNGSDEIFESDVDACLGDSPYCEGFVFEKEGRLLGYAMLAKSFSTEFGKPCIWIEDLYIKEGERGHGIGSAFFKMLDEKYKDVIFRLEIEAENERAIAVYKKCGFDFLPYMEMKKDSLF